MDGLLTAGDILSRNAALFPERLGACDLERRLTFGQWNGRACRLANAMLGLGLTKGDRVAILAYNCLEWLEFYEGLGKAGLIAVPINFRLKGPEIQYIVENCEARALIVQDELRGAIEEIRAFLPIPAGHYIHFGAAACPAGYRGYEELLAAARESEPQAGVSHADASALMYTSGTTGKPKGAIRSHRAAALHSLTIGIELGLNRQDNALLVMPMCHANSLFFYSAFAYCGAACTVYSRKNFDPEHLMGVLGGAGITFTSLVPTHYIMMLGLPSSVHGRFDTGAVKRLFISSAPARHDTKREIMECFRNSGLYEGYGSTEAGWVTMLHPDEQFTKLGSVGRECVGTAPVRLLDGDGSEARMGELFSRTPYAFDGYWKLPEKTAEAFRQGYCSVGDMARRDEDGYIYLADRKSNMIISGGENVYPSEIENLIGSNPKVKDVAVIGVPDAKWGERVHAVVILRDGAAMPAVELIDWARERIAGYKRPRSVSFISDEDMPRTATGKILHRVLRMRFAGAE